MWGRPFFFFFFLLLTPTGDEAYMFYLAGIATSSYNMLYKISHQSIFTLDNDLRGSINPLPPPLLNVLYFLWSSSCVIKTLVISSKHLLYKMIPEHKLFTLDNDFRGSINPLPPWLKRINRPPPPKKKKILKVLFFLGSSPCIIKTLVMNRPIKACTD